MNSQQKGGPGTPGTAQNTYQSRDFTLTEIFSQFTNAMLSAGIETNARIEADGCLHRIHILGHRQGTLNGAYILHADKYPAGWFQDFKSGISGTWRMDGGRWEIDQVTQRKIEADRRRRQAEREQYYAQKAAEACSIWDAATPCTRHPYLELKGVQAHGLRVGTWRKWIKAESGWKQITIEKVLFVPVLSPGGDLVNVQAVLPERHPKLDGDKFFTGGRKKGCCFWIGQPTDPILIAEGYATAASLHEHTHHSVLVAFDCGNLLDVAKVVRGKMPEATIIIAGDNDRQTPGNPGLTKAREAALAVEGKLLIPQFDDGEIGSDWNDWLTHRRFSGSLKNMSLTISPLGSFTGREAQHGV